MLDDPRPEASTDEPRRFRTRLPMPPWQIYIAVVAGLYVLVGSLVQSLQLPLGLLWSQAFLFVWPSFLILRSAGFRPERFVRATRPPRELGLVAAIAVAAFFCASGLMGVCEALAPTSLVDRAQDITRVLSSISGPWNVVLYAAVILGAPIAEETVFRGCLLPLLAGRVGVRRAVVFQAILFSAIHFDPVGFLPRFVLGLTFGWLWWLSGSLWAGIFAHALNNGVSSLLFLWFGVDSPGDLGAEHAGPGDLALVVAVALGGGAALVLLLSALSRRVRPGPLPEDDVNALALPSSPAERLRSSARFAGAAAAGLTAVLLAKLVP